MTKIKLKNGLEKDICDLSQEELKQQKQFIRIKNIKKKQDMYALIYKLNENKETIESLHIQNQKLQEEIERIDDGRKSLKLLDVLLNKYLKSSAQVLFESTWGKYVASQNCEGEDCSEEEFKQLSTLIKKK